MIHFHLARSLCLGGHRALIGKHSEPTGYSSPTASTVIDTNDTRSEDDWQRERLAVHAVPCTDTILRSLERDVKRAPLTDAVHF
jgi:hypothetical protein